MLLGRMWFVVLPDGDIAAGAVRALRPMAREVVEHASGRPWLMGVWPAGHVVLGRAGAVRVAVVGGHAPGPAELDARAARMRRAEDADRAAAGPTGDFHVLASVDGRVGVRGTAAGSRRVFRTRFHGTDIAGGRADTLAALTGAGPDEDVLALRLGAVGVVHPLEEHTVWRGVQGVRPDELLLLEADGRTATHRWWHPPRSVLPFDQGARAVRQALQDALFARTAGGAAISSDLSGGMDSTSLCFLAARTGAPLLTTTWQALDPANEDSVWARRAAAHLPGAVHEFTAREDAPAWFAAPAGAMDRAEEPFGWVHDRVKLLGALERMAAHGSRLHLSGAGGDALFSPPPAHTRDVLATHPLLALADVRHHHLHFRRALLPQLKALTDRTPLAGDLLRTAEQLTAPTPAPRRHQSWAPDIRMPPWATPDAAHAAAALLRAAAARSPQPLSPHRGVHQVLRDLRATGDAIRRLDQYTQDTLGIGYAAPYTDEAVVEAALSVRVHERVDALRYKPLLAAAMNTVVPADILARRTKGEYTADANAGLRRHRRELLDLFDTSRLADAGLIDTARLRTALRQPPTTALHAALTATLGCESWLRSLDRPATTTAPAHTRGTR
ncbi:asparagine synthase-related protein [Kitasatospora sp. cg17-2]